MGWCGLHAELLPQAAKEEGICVSPWRAGKSRVEQLRRGSKGCQRKGESGVLYKTKVGDS